MRDQIIAMARFIKEHCPSETYSGACAFCGGTRSFDSQPTHTDECAFGKALAAAEHFEMLDGFAVDDCHTRRPPVVPESARQYVAWRLTDSDSRPAWKLFWAWLSTSGTLRVVEAKRDA